jgi:hypothetical protein
MNKNALKQYNKVMANLNFEKIERVMNFLHWGWGADMSVPSIEEMKDTCEYLFMEALEEHIKNGGRNSVATGGFEVTISDNHVSIKFVLDEWFEETEE